MNKVLLFLLLLPLSLYAKMYNGTIIFNDGSLKSGLITLPKYRTSKLKFRQNPNAGTERYAIDEVREFTILDDDNETVKFIALKTAGMERQKASEDKAWLQIVKKGKISLLSYYYMVPATGGTVDVAATPCYAFYIQKPGDDFCTYIYVTTFGHRLNDRDFKDFKITLSELFKDACPNLTESLTKEDFKAKGLEIVVELYEQHCGQMIVE